MVTVTDWNRLLLTIVVLFTTRLFVRPKDEFASNREWKTYSFAVSASFSDHRLSDGFVTFGLLECVSLTLIAIRV